MTMHITANFDAGNIDIINADDKKDIQLAAIWSIVNDNYVLFICSLEFC